MVSLKLRPWPIVLIGIVAWLASVNHGSANEGDTADNTSRILGAFNETVQGAGKLGKSLKNLSDADFKGLGLRAASQNSTAWNAAFNNWRATSQSVRNSLPYIMVPTILTAADVVFSVATPAIEGDGKGAVAGAVNVGASAAVSAVGSAAGGYVFSTIGGVVGSYFPMVSTAAGVTIGGAVGPIVGVIALNYAYDKYGKQYVDNAVAGLMALGDPDPLT